MLHITDFAAPVMCIPGYLPILQVVNLKCVAEKYIHQTKMAVTTPQHNRVHVVGWFWQNVCSLVMLWQFDKTSANPSSCRQVRACQTSVESLSRTWLLRSETGAMCREALMMEITHPVFVQTHIHKCRGTCKASAGPSVFDSCDNSRTLLVYYRCFLQFQVVSEMEDSLPWVEKLLRGRIHRWRRHCWQHAAECCPECSCMLITSLLMLI